MANFVNNQLSTLCFKFSGCILLIFSCLILMSLSVQAAPEVSDELKQLRAQMQLMMKRIEELEKQQVEKQAIPVVQAPVTEEPKKGKGVVELMSENTTLTVGGRIQMNTYYDWEESKQGHLAYNVRDTRFWLKSKTKTDYGLLSATLELDLSGTAGDERTSNSHNPRLRHAYLQLGKISLGQTNSLFNSIAAPDTISAAKDDVFVRQPQMRWTESFENSQFAVSLEQPETTLTDSTGARITPGTDRFPDLITRYTWHGDWGEASVAAMGREFRNDGAVAGVADEAYGGALSLSGKFLFFDYDDLRYGIAYGNGLGRYMAGNYFNAGSIDDQGRIHLLSAIGGHIAYRHWWNESLRTSLAFAHIQTDNDDVVPDTTNKLGQSYTANLIWIPVENGQLGVEYYYQRKKVQSGLTTDSSRLLFTAIYEF